MKKKGWKELVRLMTVPLLAVSVILNIFLIFNKTKNPTGVKVIGVIDGDTIVLEGKSRVRLRYVDAPEKGLCGYDKSTKELVNLAMGKTVRIEQTIPDNYGRGMALVYDGNDLINLEMVATGWVRYHSDVTPVTEKIKEASQKAKQEKLGIYGKCQSTVNTKHPECNIKGNIDKSTNTHIYYIPGCAQYDFTVVEEDLGEQWFCTESQAVQAGYVKSKNCR